MTVNDPGVCFDCGTDFHFFCAKLTNGHCCCVRVVAQQPSAAPAPAPAKADTDQLTLFDTNPALTQPARLQSSGELIRALAGNTTITLDQEGNRVPSPTVQAGRKRAARQYQILPDTPCAWAGLLKAGGGVVPIVGCDPLKGRRAQHLHHGPDKSTNNNSDGNIHGVCPQCHNRWHALNDSLYGPRPLDNSSWLPLPEYSLSFQPHDPVTPASMEDFKRDETHWTNRKKSGERAKESVNGGRL